MKFMLVFSFAFVSVLAARADETLFNNVREHAQLIGTSLSSGAVDSSGATCEVSFTEEAGSFTLTLETAKDGKFTAHVKNSSSIELVEEDHSEGFMEQYNIDDLSVALVNLPDAFDTAAITADGKTLSCGIYR